MPKVRRATVAVSWPPDALRHIYWQSRPATVWTCPRHARWTIWPVELYAALAIETEDLAMPAPAKESALEASLRAKRDRDMGHRIPKSHGWGSRPGQSVNVLLEAYRSAGTYNGAARLLNERGVRTWKGGPWSGVVVKGLIDGYRVEPQLTEAG